MNRTYTIILEPSDEGGFIVTVPALPEVGTQGDTRAEALANAREAIELVIEHRLARGEFVACRYHARGRAGNGRSVSARLPSVRGDVVVRTLRRAGFEVVRIRGSHHVMEHQ